MPDAQGSAGAPQTFATFDDRPVAGVFVGDDAVYAGGQFGVYRIAYRSGDRDAREKPRRSRACAPAAGGGHSTTTVVLSKGTLYASVGSSCNACDETDPTRATVQAMTPEGNERCTRARSTFATRSRWRCSRRPARCGPASPDATISTHGHPYEIFDDVTAHAGTPDYGWLSCYDDRKPIGGASCANVVVPRAVFPAYDTPIGAAFYPRDAAGPLRVSGRYRGGAFVALHGSWHTPPVPPRVAFVAVQRRRPGQAGRLERTPTRSGPNSSAAARTPTARAPAGRPASRSEPTARSS